MFFSVNHKMLTFTIGPGLHRHNIRAGTGLGQGEYFFLFAGYAWG